MSSKTIFNLTKKDVQQPTQERWVIINGIPEHLSLHTAEMDNARLVIELVLVCMSGRSVSNVGSLP